MPTPPELIAEFHREDVVFQVQREKPNPLRFQYGPVAVEAFELFAHLHRIGASPWREDSLQEPDMPGLAGVSQRAGIGDQEHGACLRPSRLCQIPWRKL